MSGVLFVGRWQPCHRGHIELWKKGAFDRGYPAVIYIRDIPPNEQNPFTTGETRQMIQQALIDLLTSGEVHDKLIRDSVVVSGPDIVGIVTGRKVGYFVESVDLSEDVKAISATDIRAKIKAGLPGWRDYVTPGVADLLLDFDW